MSQNQYYCEADWSGSRATPLFPVTVPFLSLKEEHNDMKRLEENAGEEQRSRCLKNVSLGQTELTFLKFFEGATCVE